MQCKEKITAVKESPLLPRSQGCLALRTRTRSDPFLLPGRAEFFTALRSRRGNARICDLSSFFNTRASVPLPQRSASTRDTDAEAPDAANGDPSRW